MTPVYLRFPALSPACYQPPPPPPPPPPPENPPPPPKPEPPVDPGVGAETAAEAREENCEMVPVNPLLMAQNEPIV